MGPEVVIGAAAGAALPFDSGADIFDCAGWVVKNDVAGAVWMQCNASKKYFSCSQVHEIGKESTKADSRMHRVLTGLQATQRNQLESTHKD